MTHDQFVDLVRDVPEHVHADPDAAWARGTRRRLGARVATGAGAVVLLALLAALLGVLPRASDVQPVDGRSGVDGYPVRIDKPWRIGDLPDAPGPLAGLLQQGSDGWLAVSPTGELWKVPGSALALGARPALSDDGTRLAFPTELDDTTRFTVRDLVDGGDTSWELPFAQTRMAFSPDGARLVVSSRSQLAFVVLGPDGPGPELRMEQSGEVVGWSDDTHVVVVRSGRRPTVSVVRTDGDVERTVALDSGWNDQEQDEATVSPDGRRMVVPRRYDDYVGGVLDVVDLASGFSTLEQQTTAARQRCPVSWSGDQVWVSPAVTSGALLVSQVPGSERARTEVVADPGLAATCAVWAADALAGEPHRGITGTIFGTSDLPFWWWWQDALLALAAGLLARLIPFGPLWRRLHRQPAVEPHSSARTP